MHGVLVGLGTAALLSGRATIGAVNGVLVGNRVSSQGETGGSGYCAANPWVCIAGVAVGAAVLAAAVNATGGGGDGGSESAPPRGNGGGLEGLR